VLLLQVMKNQEETVTSKKTVIVKRFQLDHVFSHDKVLFNTNNHEYSEEQPAPPDYKESMNKTKTKNWIDIFHKDNYKTLTLGQTDLKWMNKALSIGLITGKCSHIYDDELEMTCNKYKDLVPKGKWFIRSDSVSLKEGKHGIGPYDNIKDIIESMVTTKPGHTCYDQEDTECKIYFMNWQQMNPDKEFRVFVYKNEITAISSQHLYTINKWLNSLSELEITEVVHKILDFFETDIKENLSYLESYTFDFAFINDNNESFGQPYFIEPNGFGKCYAAGSALYHWIYDHDTLHESDTIELRYTFEY
jgi:hypothetical protein